MSVAGAKVGALFARPSALGPSHRSASNSCRAAPCAAAAAAHAAAACRLRTASAKRSCCAVCAATNDASVARPHAGSWYGVPSTALGLSIGRGPDVAVPSPAGGRALAAVPAGMRMLLHLCAARCLLSRAAWMLYTCAAGSAATEGL